MSVTYEKTYKGLSINTDKENHLGCDTIILEKLYQQFFHMTSHHSKVLTSRFDIHYPQDNSIKPEYHHFRKFLKNYSRNLECNYKLPREGKIRSEKSISRILLLLLNIKLILISLYLWNNITVRSHMLMVILLSTAMPRKMPETYS
jgi:hypothetical protein